MSEEEGVYVKTIKGVGDGSRMCAGTRGGCVKMSRVCENREGCVRRSRAWEGMQGQRSVFEEE